jgi:hypothetical protein
VSKNTIGVVHWEALPRWPHGYPNSSSVPLGLCPGSNPRRQATFGRQ